MLKMWVFLFNCGLIGKKLCGFNFFKNFKYEKILIFLQDEKKNIYKE